MCVPPCQLLVQDKNWSAELAPFPAARLPFTIDTSENTSLYINFFAPENPPYGPRWTKRQSAIRFLLSSDWASAPEICFRITGVAVSGRQVQVLLNGEKIGAIAGNGPVSSEFVVSRDLFRAGHENELLFKTVSDAGLELISIDFQPAEVSSR